MLTFFRGCLNLIFCKNEVAAIEVIKTVKDMQRCAGRLRGAGGKISLVPTMGYLHEGHLSLFRIGRDRGDHLVASIFVNPTQFAPGEDLATYPRDFERDLALCKEENVDIVFAPSGQALYTEGYQTYVNLETLPQHLCGLSRPVFFRGVATVVTKLFNIVKPYVAVFGEKDFQQLVVVRRMVSDLNMDIDIIGGPIVREADGLAMSSRNSYLSPEQRISARSLSRALAKAQALVDGGTRDAAGIIAAATVLIQAEPETKIDYIAVCDPLTLDDAATVDRPVVMALAVKVGVTRLIDNRMLTP